MLAQSARAASAEVSAPSRALRSRYAESALHAKHGASDGGDRRAARLFIALQPLRGKRSVVLSLVNGATTPSGHDDALVNSLPNSGPMAIPSRSTACAPRPKRCRERAAPRDVGRQSRSGHGGGHARRRSGSGWTVCAARTTWGSPLRGAASIRATHRPDPARAARRAARRAPSHARLHFRAPLFLHASAPSLGKQAALRADLSLYIPTMSYDLAATARLGRGRSIADTSRR